MTPCWVQSGNTLACIETQAAWVGLEKLYARVRVGDDDGVLVNAQRSMAVMCEAIRDRRRKRRRSDEAA